MRKGVHRSASERFWLKVDKSAGPDACWPWTGQRTANGYGYFMLTVVPRRMIGAHRFAWIEANGSIPDRLLTCHHCDNRPCCNPAHLFLGLHKDNTADMIRKGRKPSQAPKTRCPHGHILVTENVYIRRTKTGTARVCRTCRSRWAKQCRRAA